MLRINNTQDIKKITMKPVAFTRCVLGGDWYKNNLVIEFVPAKIYPDYTEVQEWIMKNVDGKNLNIEDVVEYIYDFLNTNYKPLELHIKDEVTGCRTHFDVIVEK